MRVGLAHQLTATVVVLAFAAGATVGTGVAFERHATRIFAELIIGGVIAVFAAHAVVCALLRRALAPVLEVARAIRSGDVARRVGARAGGGALPEVAAAFDAALDALRVGTVSRQELETAVARRTAELAAALEAQRACAERLAALLEAAGDGAREASAGSGAHRPKPEA